MVAWNVIPMIRSQINDLLRGLIGNAGKGAEGCDICEKIVVEAADVTGRRDAFGDPANRLGGVLRDTQGPGEIVGGACRYIAHRDPFLTAHQPLKALAEGPVAAGTDQKVEAGRAGVLCLDRGVVGVLSYVDRDLVVGLVEFVDYLTEAVSDLGLSSDKINDKVKFFHCAAPIIGKKLRIMSYLYYIMNSGHFQGHRHIIKI